MFKINHHTHTYTGEKNKEEKGEKEEKEENTQSNEQKEPSKNKKKKEQNVENEDGFFARLRERLKNEEERLMSELEEEEPEKEEKDKKKKKKGSSKFFGRFSVEDDPSGKKSFFAVVLSLVFGLTAIYYLYAYTAIRGKEIDLKKLKREFIANGLVEKILIDCKKQIAFIYLKGSSKAEYYIQTGNDFISFEKQIEATEIELGLRETLIEYDWMTFDM